MSQENVEIVRRLYSLTPDAAGVVRGDYDNAFVDNFHPDVEIVPPSNYPDTPESGYRGPEGMLRWFQQLDEIWDDWRFEAERFLDAGDRVVAFVRVSGSAKQSGAALTISTAHVLTLRDGRVTRVDVFLDRPEALEAAGLREWTMSQENVELVRRALDVFNRGEDALDLLDPEIVWTTTGLFVEPDIYRGHGDVRRYVEALRNEFEELHVEPDEPIAVGEHVIVPARLTGRGRLSGAPIDATFTMLFSLREGKIVRIRNYWQKAEALEAAGLRE